jgi:hypothetical protein
VLRERSKIGNKTYTLTVTATYQGVVYTQTATLTVQ